MSHLIGISEFQQVVGDFTPQRNAGQDPNRTYPAAYQHEVSLVIKTTGHIRSV